MDNDGFDDVLQHGGGLLRNNGRTNFTDVSHILSRYRDHVNDDSDLDLYFTTVTVVTTPTSIARTVMGIWQRDRRRGIGRTAVDAPGNRSGL